MGTGGINLGQIVFHHFLIIDVGLCQCCKAHNCIHWCADIVGHTAEEGGLCTAGLLRCIQCKLQLTLLFLLSGNNLVNILIGRNDIIELFQLNVLELIIMHFASLNYPVISSVLIVILQLFHNGLCRKGIIHTFMLIGMNTLSHVLHSCFFIGKIFPTVLIDSCGYVAVQLQYLGCIIFQINHKYIGISAGKGIKNSQLFFLLQLMLLQKLPVAFLFFKSFTKHCLHLMLVIHQHYKAVCAYGRTICLPADMGGVTNPVIFPIFIAHPVFHIIGCLSGIITDSIFVASIHTDLVIRVQLIHPGIPGIWKIL